MESVCNGSDVTTTMTSYIPVTSLLPPLLLWRRRQSIAQTESAEGAIIAAQGLAPQALVYNDFQDP